MSFYTIGSSASQGLSLGSLQVILFVGAEEPWQRLRSLGGAVWCNLGSLYCILDFGNCIIATLVDTPAFVLI